MKKSKDKLISDLKAEVLKGKKEKKRLIGQYERVVKDWKGIAEDLKDNAPKLFFVWLAGKWNKIRGK